MIYAGMLMLDSGETFAIVHTITGGSVSVSTLYKLEEDGSVGWSRTLNNWSTRAPFLNNAGDICVVDENDEYYAYDIDGNQKGNFVLPVHPIGNLFATITSEGDSMLFLDQTDHLRTQRFDNSAWWHGLLGEEGISSVSLNNQGHRVFGTRTTDPDPVTKLNYYDGGTEVWDMVIAGDFLSPIAVDSLDRMYYTTFWYDESAPTTSNGLYCVEPDQTISWFYPTEARYLVAPILVGDDLIVGCIHPAYTGEEDPFHLIGIRGNP
jgi:hypothetical protein